MHNINNYIFFLFFFCSSLFTIGQINVFENHCISFDANEFDYMPNVIETHCTELPKNENGVNTYSFNEAREIKAASFIELSDEMELTPNGTGSLTAYIEEPTYEVVAFVNNLNTIDKLEKFELGIKPPESILIAIQNFINNTGTPKLNPFMSHDIDIQAVFTNVYTDTIIYDMYPDPPEVVINTNEVTKKRDGFFTKDVERDISGFDSLYYHPLANNTQVVTGNAYKNLGGGWTVTDSEYPFRIRFAPPRVGEWFCHIKVKILNQIDYISPTFQFNVVNSTKKNYLKVDNNKRFLKQDGESFRPLGVNYPAPIREGYPLRSLKNGNRLVYRPEYHGQLPPIAHYEQYLRMMDTLAMNGANYFRMIMNPWSLDLEYEKLGDYSDRMHIAEEMDLILERAAANDMLIHLNLMIHFHFQENPFDIKIWDWTDENGGSGYCYKNELNLNSPIEFFTNETARAYYKERLRYIIARWGYSSDIAMFEHFSEIDQIGTEHDENAEAISFTNQYAGNEAVFNEWHGEMSWYLKEVLEIPQLLTLSYTTKHNEDLDHSFWHGNIDVINLNNYNYFNGGATPPHVYPFRDVTYNMFKKDEKGVYNKPVFYSEMGAHEVWDCDNNVENRRSIWQSYFLGIAGGLEWDKTKDLSIYSRARSFIEGVDLEGGNWHPGAFDRENDGEWKYNDNYHDDCVREDELADVVYLRSGDKNKAFGVITNRRANYYTLGEGECADNSGILTAPLHSKHDNDPSTLPDLTDYTVYSGLLQEYGNVGPDGGDNRLRIRNMKLSKEYKIKYYSPYDLVNSIKEETRWGPKLTLEFPDLDTLDIVLFEVFRMGGSFKSMQNDSTNSDNNDKLSRELKKNITDNIKVFPNPNDGTFVILVENPSDAKAIYITDNLGKRIDSRYGVTKENYYNKINFKSGIYFIEAVFEDKVIRRKIIIN